MDRIILNIKDKLYDGDILIFEGDKLKPISKSLFLEEVYAEINKTNSRIDEVNEKIELISEQLRRMHDVVALLIKEQDNG